MTTSIGSRLKSLRLKKGLTQEQMAEAFGLSAQAVSRWENDCAYPDITLLPGRPFGCTPEYIQLGVDFTPKASASEMLDRLRAFLEESQNV